MCFKKALRCRCCGVDVGFEYKYSLTNMIELDSNTFNSIKLLVLLSFRLLDEYIYGLNGSDSLKLNGSLIKQFNLTNENGQREKSCWKRDYFLYQLLELVFVLISII